MKRRNNRKIRIKPWFRFLIYTVVFISLFSFCENRVKLLPEEYLELNAKNYTDETINKTIIETFENFKNTYNITISEDDELSFLEIEAIDISILKAELVTQINKELSGNKFTFVPIGSLLNYNLLSGFGFSIPINMYYTGSCSVEIETTLLEVGINQSVYQLTAVVLANLINVSVNESVSVEVLSSYPLGEVYITGDVPSYRMNVS